MKVLTNKIEQAHESARPRFNEPKIQVRVGLVNVGLPAFSSELEESVLSTPDTLFELKQDAQVCVGVCRHQSRKTNSVKVYYRFQARVCVCLQVRCITVRCIKLGWEQGQRHVTQESVLLSMCADSRPACCHQPTF